MPLLLCTSVITTSTILCWPPCQRISPRFWILTYIRYEKSLSMVDRQTFSFLGIQNGFISALPYLAQLISTLIIGRLVDRLRTRKTFSITVLRKGQTVIGRTDVRRRNELYRCLELSLRYAGYLRMSRGHWLHEMWSCICSYLLYCFGWLSGFSKLWGFDISLGYRIKLCR